MEIEAAVAEVTGSLEGGGKLEYEMEGGGGGGGCSSGAYLVWEDLTVVLPNSSNKPTRRILNGLTGFAQPSRIMAIMGPSGSGKSTLLDSLAGRLAGNVIMTGGVLLNGKKKRLDYGAVGFLSLSSSTELSK